MTIVEEEVEVSITFRNVGYYRNLGYIIPKESVPCHLVVKTTQLPHTSPVKIHVLCDYCGSTFVSTPRLVYEMGKAYTNKCACKKCQGEKLKETILNKYGVNSYADIHDFEEKRKATNLQKYGAENPFASKEIQNKIKVSLMEKYGVKHSGQIEAGKEKAKITNMARYGVSHSSKLKETQDKKRHTVKEKYGVECVSQLEEVKEKAKQSCLARYGVEHYSQLPEHRQRMSALFLENNEPPSSFGQDHICQMVNGQLNYRCHGFFLDVLYEDWLDIEYNGTGHNLSVKFGLLSQKEFDKKERQRKASIFGYGYKMLVLYFSKSKRDKLPKDDLLKPILMSAISRLKHENINELAIDLDTLTIIA